MESHSLFWGTVLLTYSGFTVAWYGSLADRQIHFITKTGMNKGKDMFADENVEHYSYEIEKWRKGAIFSLSISRVVGLFIALIASFVNLIDNRWWTVFLSLFIGYLLFLQLTKSFKWRVQLIAIVTFLFGILLLLI